MPNPLEITEVLKKVRQGDQRAVDELLPMVYDQLRLLAHQYFKQQPSVHTLQPTAVVHEAYLKLCKQQDVDWRNRSHFFAVSANAMRNILVDHARGKAAEKRGGGLQRIEFDEGLLDGIQSDENVLALDEALTKLEKLDQRQAKIVELRFFGGLIVKEIAEAMGISKRTVELEWKMIRVWLRRELSENQHEGLDSDGEPQDVKPVDQEPSV